MSDANLSVDLKGPLEHLGGLTAAEFLRDYWQKKPLLIRNAFPDIIDLVDGDTLAGLALEESVESRFIQEKDNNEWRLEHGPFDEAFFEDMPASHWTLLVQAVDHYLPEVADILDGFAFIPRWRIDDVMVSYAADKGTVGPHSDYYDVFLIQGEGSREWQIGQPCDETTSLIPKLPLKILSHFEQAESWVLQPGDMLYLPPGLAHWGIAVGESITYSVGFRAASQGDMITDFAHYLSEKLPDHSRYSDPDLTPTSTPGLIDKASIERVKALLQEALAKPGATEDWLGEFLTQPKYEPSLEPCDPPFELKEIKALLNQGGDIRVDENTRCNYLLNENGQHRFFINGNAIEQPAGTENLLMSLCDARHLTKSDLSNTELEWLLLTDLVNQGVVFIEQ